MLVYQKYNLLHKSSFRSQYIAQGFSQLFRHISLFGYSKINFCLYFSSCLCTRMSSRCLWDADTDNYAEDIFMNVGTFCCFHSDVRKRVLSKQFFNKLCFPPIGQLVLCGGSFWKLLLLRKRWWMTEDHFRWSEMKIQLSILGQCYIAQKCDCAFWYRCSYSSDMKLKDYLI